MESDVDTENSPSETIIGLNERTTIRGPGGEKKNHLGELTVKVRAEEHGGGDISSGVTYHGTKVRKPLLAVSG